MNRKKIILSLVALIIFIAFVITQGITYAYTDLDPVKYFKLSDSRDNGVGYAIQDPNENGGARIWNIAEVNKISDGSIIGGTDIYCLKAGYGFNSTGATREYSRSFDMKTERDDIANSDLADATVNGLTTGTLTVEGEEGSVDKYNAILALGDMLLTSSSTEDEKVSLLNDAGVKYLSEDTIKEIIEELKKDNINYNTIRTKMSKSSLSDTAINTLSTTIKNEQDEAKNIEAVKKEASVTKLTYDDIFAVQQAALWYYTNSGENAGYNLYNPNGYENGSNGSWLYTKTGTGSYSNIGSDKERDEREAIQRDVQKLYNYLVKTAKNNASNTNSGAPASVTTESLSGEEKDSTYIIGPIHITEATNNTKSYTIDFEVKNGTTPIEYSLLDNTKEDVTSTKTVKDLVGQDFYISVDKDGISTVSVDINIKYSNTDLTLYTNGKKSNEQPLLIPEKINDEVPTNLTFTPNGPEKTFDLALRKYITKVTDKDGNVIKSETDLADRNPNVNNKIDTSTLETEKTATYKHRKYPVEVSEGDIVTYKLTIYNEGDKEGKALILVDQLPTGLEFVRVVSGDFNGTVEEGNRLVLQRKTNGGLLAPYTNGNLDSEDIEIECKVTATAGTQANKVLTNVAWISTAYNREDGVTITNQQGADRDSEPSTKPDVNKDNMENYTGNGNKSDLTDSNYYYKGQQDDDDFEKVVLLPESFDLKLIKRITEVNGNSVPERIEDIDVSELNITGSDSKTTADYNLNKEPVSVKKGDIVTYTFRVYNEGTIDGYAAEITEDIPEGLEYLCSDALTDEEVDEDATLTDAEKAAIKYNRRYLWTYADSTLKTIKTDYLSKEQETTESNLIKAFGKNDGTKTKDELKFKEISVKLKVVSADTIGTVIRNEAEISKDTDKDGNEIDDRDSDTDRWVKYEDDEDYDNVILQSFDLSLRKFIVAVSEDDKIEDSEYLKNEKGSYKREPVVDTSKLNTTDENGEMITTATYNHTKEPVLVQKNNIVVYMLRVYNEGDIDGYASEIKDHLPSYLQFVDGDFNKKYGWEISDDGRTATTDYLKDSKIKAAEFVPKDGVTIDSNGEAKGVSQEYKLSYKEVPIMCKVVDSAKTNENITNIADITKYLDENKNEVTDRDSQEDNVDATKGNRPDYKDDEKGDYIPGQQDDDDFEKVIVKEFDLALRKWVTQAIVIENGGQTVTETGHQPYDDPEQVVKVELHRKKLDQVVVKFRYSIRVINEGDIAGYAKEVTDYVPAGLKFLAEDNTGWTDEGNNVISTRLLENTLLQPGEYADVEVVLTWINSENNMGVMNNVAEISEDYNEYGVPDKDSTPDNQKLGEDDIDDAPVMLSVSTGQLRVYFTLGFVVLVTLAGGVMLIKKYVL